MHRQYLKNFDKCAAGERIENFRRAKIILFVIFLTAYDCLSKCQNLDAPITASPVE